MAPMDIGTFLTNLWETIYDYGPMEPMDSFLEKTISGFETFLAGEEPGRSRGGTSIKKKPGRVIRQPSPSLNKNCIRLKKNVHPVSKVSIFLIMHRYLIKAAAPIAASIALPEIVAPIVPPEIAAPIAPCVKDPKQSNSEKKHPWIEYKSFNYCNNDGSFEKLSFDKGAKKSSMSKKIFLCKICSRDSSWNCFKARPWNETSLESHECSSSHVENVEATKHVAKGIIEYIK